MTDDEALVREQIAQTREELAEKVEAIRAKVDVRHRGEEKLRSWQETLTGSAKEFREGFTGSRATTTEPATPALDAAADAHPEAARRGARARKLGEAAAAAGWRRKAAEQVAPRLAGSAPVSGDEVRALLGLTFLAMSGFYVLKTLLTALRHRDIGQPQPAEHAVTRPHRTTVTVLASSRPARAERRTRRTSSRRGGRS